MNDYMSTSKEFNNISLPITIMNELLKYILLLVISSFALVTGRNGFGPGEQDWGYVEVRPKCHMFWWLHYTTADKNYTQRPLLIWLQGGPAGSASGEGNILMSGLVDEDLNVREYSYVKKANVLYIDSPVGAGYSYVEKDMGGGFVTNTSELANDLMVLLKEFFKLHPEFETVPLFIMGESFGGKFAPAVGEKLHQEQLNGNIKTNLQGVGMAYPATQQLHNIAAIGDTLYHEGIIDQKALNVIRQKELHILENSNLGKWEYAWNLTKELQGYISNNYNLSFFKMTENLNDEYLGKLNKLPQFMDNTVSPLLNLTVSFGKQRELAADAIVDKLKATTSSVMYLLDKTKVKVFIYNGQLDWVINVQGTYSWVKSMAWHGSKKWNAVKRNAFYVNGIHEGDQKVYDQLSFYWIERAGHSLPNHNPNAMNYILEREIGF